MTGPGRHFPSMQRACMDMPAYAAAQDAGRVIRAPRRGVPYNPGRRPSRAGRDR